jgi:hypothetical protein
MRLSVLGPRKDVRELCDWIDVQLKHLAFDFSNRKSPMVHANAIEAFQTKQQIFSLAIGELIRQEAEECKERA